MEISLHAPGPTRSTLRSLRILRAVLLITHKAQSVPVCKFPYASPFVFTSYNEIDIYRVVYYHDNSI